MILKKVTTHTPGNMTITRPESAPRKTVWYLLGIPVHTSIVRYCRPDSCNDKSKCPYELPKSRNRETTSL